MDVKSVVRFLITRSLIVTLPLTMGLVWPVSEASAAHANALWRVVKDLCLTNMRLTGHPAPCLAVDRKIGVAVVPDPQRPTQILLTPTVRVAGIESPVLQRPGWVNYWQAAWDARRYFEARAHRAAPRDTVAMAINSPISRSQNQLHIHVDCVQPSVRAALKAHESEIGSAWAPLNVRLAGRLYRARRLDGAELGERDPFKLLALDDPADRGPLSLSTLVVVGAVFADGSPGFILLSDHADGETRNPAFGEGLQDHACAILRSP